MTVCSVPANKPIITITKGDTDIPPDEVHTLYIEQVDTVYHKANTPYVDQGATAMMMLIDGTFQETPVSTVLNTVPPPLGQCFFVFCASTDILLRRCSICKISLMIIPNNSTAAQRGPLLALQALAGGWKQPNKLTEHCDIVGRYVVEYEAFGPAGSSERATRKVIVGTSYLARKHGNS